MANVATELTITVQALALEAFAAGALEAAARLRRSGNVEGEEAMVVLAAVLDEAARARQSAGEPDETATDPTTRRIRDDFCARGELIGEATPAPETLRISSR